MLTNIKLRKPYIFAENVLFLVQNRLEKQIKLLAVRKLPKHYFRPSKYPK